ncbi:pseudouridine synthase, partial [Cryptosporangium japonicum]|uniref:pseudouridine synthase n=1 Tax=Cryptosporangium japonicum TaxID=80872 RepID=UPI0031D31E62
RAAGPRRESSGDNPRRGGAPRQGTGGGRGGAPRSGSARSSRDTDSPRIEPLGRDGQPAPKRVSRTVGRGKAATDNRPYQDIWEEEEGDPNWAAKLDEPKEGERLQKVLASAGIGSRRACEELIEQGRVSVDGKVVQVQGKRVDPLTAVIHVDGQRVIVDDRMVYMAFNKPTGVITAMSDDKGRLNIGDYVQDRETRVFHVGRLDTESEGLLLLTNDGALAHRLTHPSYGVLKTYLAEVPGPMSSDVKKRLLEGVELEDGFVKVDDFRVVDNLPGKLLVEVVIHEGRKHVVRRLLEEVGHPVSRLVRTAIGPVQLANIKPGKARHLSQAEIGQLHSQVGL